MGWASDMEAAPLAPAVDPQPQAQRVEDGYETVILPPEQQLGFSIDFQHEPDAVFMSVRIRIPKAAALPLLIGLMLGKGSGFARTYQQDGAGQPAAAAPPAPPAQG